MKKTAMRITAFILTILMFINVLPVSAFVGLFSLEIMTLSASSASSMPGETVEVVVELENNPGISSLKFDVEYDDVLTLTDVRFNNTFNIYSTAPKPYTNPQTISMLSPMKEITADGRFVTLTFLIAEDAQDGHVANVELVYNPDDIYDGDYNNITTNVANASIWIYDGMPGDINGDNKVNNIDAILLFRYVADNRVEVDTSAVDVNDDEKLNNKDATLLFRHIAGWRDEVIKRGSVCTHVLEAVAAAEPGCTETGNEAYWQCTECNKMFSDSRGYYLITEIPVIAATGHTYSEEWTSDATYHWHVAVCEHTDEISEKVKHTLDDNKVCTVCENADNAPIQLDTPVITCIEYDTVTWEDVDNASGYTVVVNGEYSWETGLTEMKLDKVLDKNSNPITKHGNVSVVVYANGDGDKYLDSAKSAAYTYYYVPRTAVTTEDGTSANTQKLGYGYNLITKEYLSREKSSEDSVLDFEKLLTIGKYNKGSISSGNM